MKFLLKGIGKTVGPFIINTGMLIFLCASLVVLLVFDFLFALWHLRLPKRDDSSVRALDQDPAWSYVKIFFQSLGTFTLFQFVKAYCTKIFIFMRDKEDVFEEGPRRRF